MSDQDWPAFEACPRVRGVYQHAWRTEGAVATCQRCGVFYVFSDSPSRRITRPLALWETEA